MSTIRGQGHPPINNATLAIVTEVLTGKTSVEAGQKQMQAAAEKVLADFA